MKRMLPLFTLQLLVVFFYSFAQSPTEKTNLWKISGKDLKEPSYLFGTFHLLCPEDLQVSNTLKKRFDKTRQLFLEIDFSNPNIGVQMTQAMTMRNDTTLHDLYDQETYDSVSRVIERTTHVGLEMFNKTKPFGLYAVILMGALECQPASWELNLVKMAQEKNMQINGLETVEGQAAIFDRIPYILQARQLKEMAFNIDSTRGEIQHLITIYKDQNIQAMHNRITNDPLMERFLGPMLYDRNTQWISTIIQQAKEASTFFAFGAGHLGGDKGVIALLRKNGYIVSPILEE
ncbi:TraB/GumN family protein [Olivibacter sp. SDN3]|uniref:TraB/GumN family protein n=1 Tax=Olivibacter sp. SDN3 TaxID=2764720 RepID=UPI0016513FAF|nr:TraB/GumN family protein [Olivibacter sp. SDN3]QNL51257.1 TraB/GumN family protein [Olivibacter sp. SDN3]